MIRHRRSDAPLLWGGLLVALGAAMLAQSTGLVPESAGNWTGAAILAAIGFVFVALYLVERIRWWALIPGGTMLSLAVVSAVTPFVSGEIGGALFLLGMAGTFAVVAIAPSPGRPRTWAWIPAAVMLVLGAITLGSTQAAAFWPVALILLG
ncbi:MAG TPA: hypothetical protein VIC57_08110, partial [Candidatus Dormibacteraeota bacterium]